MSAFKPEQRYLTIGGRVFHFVSYEGRPANPRRNEEAQPAMWYLMVEGRRCPAMPCDPDQSDAELDRRLIRWAEHNALGPNAGRSSTPAAGARAWRSSDNWWGPN